jgi:hypothetical protein
VGRWVIAKTSDPETGSNAGSNFGILRYSDAGGNIGGLTINRATGAINAGGTVAVSPATAAGQAPQVTAIDAVTGRLAIGGVEMGSTGRRNVTADMSNIDPANTGQLLVTRVGNVVTWDFNQLLLLAGTGVINLSTTLPLGFRPDRLTHGAVCRWNSGSMIQWVSFNAGVLTWLSEQNVGNAHGGTTTTRPTVGITGQVSYRVTSAFPTALPGVPG